MLPLSLFGAMIIWQGMTATASAAGGMSVVPFKFKAELDVAMTKFSNNEVNAVEIVSRFINIDCLTFVALFCQYEFVKQFGNIVFFKRSIK